MNFITKSEKETISLGQKFGRKLKGGEIYLLTGDLGGGKTQFTKGLAMGLGISEPITSPTFNYENIYKTPSGLTLYHFDLYRNENLDEDIRDLMLEAFADKQGITVVEWAERAEGHWPKGARLISFIWQSEDRRKLKVKRI